MADPQQSVPLKAIEYLMNHTFLPPKLPNGDDSDRKHESILLDTVVDSLKGFRECVAQGLRDSLDSATAMIANIGTIHGSSGLHGPVREGAFRSALQDLPKTGKNMSSTSPNLRKST